jgi:glycosidase
MKKFLFLLITLSFIFTACSNNPRIDPGNVIPISNHPKGMYGNYYEIFVGSFYDSDGDGMGDIRGIIEKLDYLNDGNPNSTTSLGIDGIWLMPIHPSPTYHKYDVVDYKAIDPAYGTLQDFKDLIAECEKRGIRVIIDLVVNHTSNIHPWFEEARRGNSTYMNYYNVSRTRHDRSWYALGNTGRFYEAVFWNRMPDLNWDSRAVKREFMEIIDFWLDLGVAGFRLDAVKHIYERNTQKNIEWLRWFTNYCKSRKADVYIVAEVWDSERLIAQYYESGVPSNFNFRAQSRELPHTARNNTPAEDFAHYVVNWNNTIKSINKSAIDAPFLTNHDINRFATILGENVNNIRLKKGASLLLFMPGNPFIYYGEELGMTGRLPKDENVRGPMIWSRRNRTGQTTGPLGNDQPYWDASSVEEQLADANSILRYYIEAIRLKNRYPQIHWGDLSVITTTASDAIAAYRITCQRGNNDIAVVHNLSNSNHTVTITGASAVGGTLTASSATAPRPTLSGNSLTMPAFTTAIVEF